MLRSAVVLLSLCPGPLLADADHAPALKTGPATSIQAYARQNPTCAEWTDGCAVCVSQDGKTHCSTPGIACTPAGLTCRRHVP